MEHFILNFSLHWTFCHFAGPDGSPRWTRSAWGDGKIWGHGKTYTFLKKDKTYSVHEAIKLTMLTN